MTKDVEHFFKYISAIQDSSVENFLFSSVPYSLIGLFGSLECKFLSSLYILDISPLSDVKLVNILSQLIGCNLFTLIQCPFNYRNFSFDKVPFVNF